MVGSKYTLLGVLVLLLVCSAQAQKTGCGLTLRGRIAGADSSGLGGIQAAIQVAKTNNGTITDSAGGFLFTNLCPGKLEIIITSLGYRTVDTVVRIKQNAQIGFTLVPAPKQLSNVTVTGEVIHRDQISTAVKTTLTGQALQETRGLSLGESLKGITGVNSLQTGPSISKPIIHGLYSNRILIMNNGIRQEGQNWGNDHAPEIDPFIATKVTVVKGAASIRYGSDAIGGVILLDPKDMSRQPGTTDGEVNLVGMSNGQVGVASAMLEGAAGGKLDGLSWRAQGTVKRAGNAQAATYYMGNTGFMEDDYSGTLQYNKKNFGTELYYSRFDTKIGIASATHIGTLADLYEAFARSEPAVKADFSYDIGRPYQTVNHQLVKASGFINLKDFGKIETTYAFQEDIRKEYDADVSFNDSIARLNLPDLYFKLFTNTADVIWQHPAIKKKIVGSIGVNYITHGNSQQGTGYTELIPNFVDYGGGAFVIEKYEANKWTFEAGVRYDYKWLRAYKVNPTSLAVETPTYNWGNTTVNAGASYRFSQHFSSTFNFGSAWRAPQAIELFANGIHQSAASYERGDSSLQLEKAYNSSLGLKYSDDHFEAELVGYVNYFHDYIYLKPDSVPIVTIQGAFPSFTYTQAPEALFTGFDISLSYNFLNHFTVVSKTSIVRARNLTEHDWLINIPADRFDNSIRYNLRSWGRVNDFFIGISNLAVAKQTRVPPKSDYVPPPAGYILWGVEAGCTVPVHKLPVNISCTVTNLANVSYRDYLNRFRYFLNDLGRNVALRIKVPLDFSKKHT